MNPAHPKNNTTLIYKDNLFAVRAYLVVLKQEIGKALGKGWAG